jgi:hypothetical protein
LFPPFRDPGYARAQLEITKDIFMKMIALATLLFVTAIAMPAGAYSRHGHASHEYYTSVDGHRVHGPDYNPHNVSAHCEDGTLSHSRHHRGTCSGHGGVAHWG